VRAARTGRIRARKEPVCGAHLLDFVSLQPGAVVDGVCFESRSAGRMLFVKCEIVRSALWLTKYFLISHFRFREPKPKAGYVANSRKLRGKIGAIYFCVSTHLLVVGSVPVFVVAEQL
jgi:hypothetical protein